MSADLSLKTQQATGRINVKTVIKTYRTDISPRFSITITHCPPLLIQPSVSHLPHPSSSRSTYLHTLFNLLSTDTAIINRGEERSRPRLLRCGGQASCPHSWISGLEQRSHTDPGTPRSKEQSPATPADFLRLSSLISSSPGQSTRSPCTALAERLLLCQGGNEEQVGTRARAAQVLVKMWLTNIQ